MSDDDSDNEEDVKMQQLLSEWDDKEEDKDDLYVDTEEDEEDVPKKKEKKEKKKKKDKKKKKEAAEDGDEMTYMTADDDDAGGDEPIVDELKKKPKKKKDKAKAKKLTDADDDDDEEDAEMKKLMAAWDEDNDAEEDDDEDEVADEDDDDESSDASEREVILDDNVIDHIVLAAPDLEEAMGEFEKKTGVAVVIAGTVKGLGIKCARISFTDSSYLEIIAPDPKGPGPIGELIKSKGIKELVPFHYAIRTKRAEELKDEVAQFGYTPDHITMFGAKPDGTPRKWEMLYLYGHKIGGTCPFFINWATSDHPCATLPVVGQLKKLTIRAPEDDPVHKLLAHVGAEGITVEVGDKAKLAVTFSSPEGTVKFSTHKAVGFKFPGFEADVGVIDGDDGEQDADVEFDNPEAPDLLPVDDDLDDDDDDDEPKRLTNGGDSSDEDDSD